MPDSISCPSGGHQPREMVDRPSPPSGGSGVNPSSTAGTWLAESQAKLGLYKALTILVVSITPAAIALAGLLVEAAKKDSKS